MSSMTAAVGHAPSRLPTVNEPAAGHPVKPSARHSPVDPKRPSPQPYPRRSRRVLPGQAHGPTPEALIPVLVEFLRTAQSTCPNID